MSRIRPIGVKILRRVRTGAPGSPKRTWAEKTGRSPSERRDYRFQTLIIRNGKSGCQPLPLPRT